MQKSDLQREGSKPDKEINEHKKSSIGKLKHRHYGGNDRQVQQHPNSSSGQMN